MATRRIVRLLRLRALVGVVGTGAAIHAQDLEPRAYSNLPIGLNFVLAGYGYAEGSVLTDPSLPVENVHNESHVGVLAFATAFDVLGQSSKFDLIVPYGSLFAEGIVLGSRRVREVTGFGDPSFRFSMNFVGAPALTAEEFSDYRQDFIFGASLRVGVPLGHYDDDRLVNLGSNRWSFRPEMGFSKALGRWTFELAPAVTLFTDNGDFFGGRTREQAPVYSVRGHVSYSFAPGFWLGIDGAWFDGGRTTIDGIERNDEQGGTRWGVTLAIPITRRQSLKLYAATGFNASRDHDFDAVGIAWQYRWGGGF